MKGEREIIIYNFSSTGMEPEATFNLMGVMFIVRTRKPRFPEFKATQLGASVTPTLFQATVSEPHPRSQPHFQGA